MAAGMIRREVKRLTTMVNEVLDFTRQTPGTVALEPMWFSDFVSVFIEEVGPLAGDRGVKLLCETPPPEVAMQIDERRLVQAFYNLVNNAADFMPKGGTVTLRFALSENELTVEVEDSGTGIAPEIARGAVRFSLGVDNTPAQVDAFLAAVKSVVTRFRDMTAMAA